MNHRFFDALVSFGAVLIFVGCSAELPTSPSAERGRSIIEGNLAEQNQFPSTLLIRTDIRNCSAVKVGKHVGLTSAQCFTSKPGFSVDKIKSFHTVGAGTVPDRFVLEAHKIKGLKIHPGYDKFLAMDEADKRALSDEQYGASVLDVAFFVTETELPGAVAKLDFDPVRLKDLVLAAGFGCKEKEGRQIEPLHFASKQVNGVIGLSFFLPPQNHLSELKSIHCDGDSGGGVYRLVKKSDGTVAPGALVGVSKMDVEGHWMISGIANDWVKSVLSKFDK